MYCLNKCLVNENFEYCKLADFFVIACEKKKFEKNKTTPSYCLFFYLLPIGPITMQKCEAKHSGANHYSKIVTILSDFVKLCKNFEAKLFPKRNFEAKHIF